MVFPVLSTNKHGCKKFPKVLKTQFLNRASSRKVSRVRYLLHAKSKSLIHNHFSVKVGIKSRIFHPSGGKKHVCHVCDKAFACKRNHQSHLLSHKYEKSYNVGNCAFSNKRTLKNLFLNKRHLKSHHVCNPARRSRVKTPLGTLNLIEGSDIKPILATQKTEKRHIYAKLNRIRASKLKSYVVDPKKLIKCILPTHEDVDSPMYEVLNFTEEKEVVGLLVNQQSEVSHARNILNLSGGYETRSFKTYKDDESHVYAALNLSGKNEVKSDLYDEDSPIYEELNLESEIKSHFTTHIDEESLMYKPLNPSQEGDIKTLFTSYKDGIPQIFEVLKSAEGRKLKTSLIAHSNKNNFVGVMCKRSFRQKLGPKMHSFKHTKMKYVCYVCNQTFAVKFCLQSHLLTHPRKNLHICKVCNMAFSEKGVLESHLSTHKDEDLHVCDACSRIFAQQSHLKTHLLTHKNAKHLGKVCNKSSCLKARPRRCSSKHTIVKKFVCHVCDKAFVVEWCLQNHMLTHSRKVYHVCDVCHAAFSEEISLQNHIVMHTDIDSNVPEVDILSHKSNLKAHRAKLTNPKMNIRYFPLTIQCKTGSFRGTGLRKHQCNGCNKAFIFKWSLQRHLHTHSSEKVQAFFEKDNAESRLSSRSDKEPCEFEECNQVRGNDIKPPLPPTHTNQMYSKSLSQEVGLKTRRYKRNQVKKHKCTICSKEFAMKLKLQRHLLTHANVKSHCVPSGYSFEHPLTIQTDELDESKVSNQAKGSNFDAPLPIHTMHNCFPLKAKPKMLSFKRTRAKKHKCNECNKSFFMKWSLQHHQLAHTCKNSHACQVCRIAFSDKVSLESHLVTHKDEEYKFCNQASIRRSIPQFRPKYACNICNQVFSQKVWLKVHNLKHISAKKQVYIVCDKSFAMKRNLQKHLHTDNLATLEPIHLY